MAAATSAPELFVNVIGTFITEGDIGVGTIVGSAVFNILAVAACCGLAAGMVRWILNRSFHNNSVLFSFLQVVPLDWWPVTRDCVAYGVTVSILIVIIHDERVEWYEALVLVSLYIVYIAIMMYDKSIKKCVMGSIENMNQAKNEKKLRKQQNIAGKGMPFIRVANKINGINACSRRDFRGVRCRAGEWKREKERAAVEHN